MCRTSQVEQILHSNLRNPPAPVHQLNTDVNVNLLILPNHNELNVSEYTRNYGQYIN